MVVESVLIVLGVLLISFLFAPLGLGGGLLYVPLFHYVGGWSLDQKLSKNNKWQKLLPENIRESLEDNFKKEMMRSPNKQELLNNLKKLLASSKLPMLLNISPKSSLNK